MSAGSPILIAPDGFGSDSRGKLLSIGLIVESEVDLWPTGLPDHRRGIVAIRALPPRKTPEDRQSCSRIIQAGRSVSLNYRAHDEVRLGLTVLKECHGTLAIDCSKRKRPARSRATGRA
jgi:hypothetical protein